MILSSTKYISNWIQYFQKENVNIFINYLEGEYYTKSLEIMEHYRFSPGSAVYYSINHLIVDKPNWVTYHTIHHTYSTGTDELYMGTTDEYFAYLYSKLDEYKLLYDLPNNIEQLFSQSYMYLDLIATSSANGILVQRGIEYATDKNEEMRITNIPHNTELFKKFTTCIYTYYLFNIIIII